MRNKVLLVFPPFTKPALTEYAPIGICSLAAYALRKFPNLEVKLQDYTGKQFRIEEWRKLLQDFKPDLVGISIITLNAPWGMRLAKIAREILPNTPVIMGGVHAVTSREECLEYCDAVTWGDGEDTLCELIEDKPWGTIKGLAYWNNGKIIYNEKRPFTLNLDDLPFPNYDLIDIKRYSGYPAWSVISNRGCPFNCIFCDNNVMWDRVTRFRSPKHIVDELEELHNKYGIRHIEFQDDLINLPCQRAIDICNEIISRGLQKEMSFYGSLRVNKRLVSQEMFDRLKEANFVFLGIGVESGSQKVLDIMRKSLTPQEVRDAVRMARKAGIKRIRGYIMVGNWGETIWDVMKTWWLTIPSNMETAYSVCTPFPSTEFNRLVTEAGYLSQNPDWENFNITSVTTRTDKMGKRTIFVVYAVSILLQFIFALTRGGDWRWTLYKIWLHGTDIVKRKLSR